MNVSMLNKSKKQAMAIIVASPLTQNIYERIGAGILSESFDVTVIDCLEWVRHYERKPDYNPMINENIYEANSEIEFITLLTNLAPSFVLDFLGRGSYTRQIQEVCNGLGILYITHSLTPSPVPISQTKLVSSLVNNPVETVKKIFPFIWRKISQKGTLSPDIALLAGSESKNAWTKTAKKIIYTAGPAFHELRKARSNKDATSNLPAKDYILFIDDCLALSFDFQLGSQTAIIPADEYFLLLNSFFSKIEKFFNIPVVIAAHPNGKEYSNYGLRFNNRVTIFDATAQLTLSCRFVMTHVSTAINYAVLLRKPIGLLYFDQLNNTPHGLQLKLIHRLLECERFEIDRFFNLKKSVNYCIDEPSYKDYEEKYITNINVKSSNSFAELIAYLKSLN